jgi:hypothetical protein
MAAWSASASVSATTRLRPAASFGSMPGSPNRGCSASAFVGIFHRHRQGARFHQRVGHGFGVSRAISMTISVQLMRPP